MTRAAAVISASRPSSSHSPPNEAAGELQNETEEASVPWNIFTGTGNRRSQLKRGAAIPDPPPWRNQAVTETRFVSTPELLEAVNAALHLRRPLLLTGPPGSGKSTLVRVIAAELQLGEPLNWHVTSRSTLTDALYQYDALGRLHATQVDPAQDNADATRGRAVRHPRPAGHGPSVPGPSPCCPY